MALRSVRGIHAPCGIVAIGPVKPCVAHLSRHEIAVHDHAARSIEQTPRHGDAFIIRPDCERRAPRSRDRQRRGAAVQFALGEVARPSRRA